MILRKSSLWEEEMKTAILDKVLVSVSQVESGINGPLG